MIKIKVFAILLQQARFKSYCAEVRVSLLSKYENRGKFIENPQLTLFNLSFKYFS